MSYDVLVIGGGPGGQLRHSGIVEDRGSAPGDGAVRTGAEYGSRCLGHLTDAPGGVLPQTVLQSADGPLQHYLVRDDVILVAPLDPADGQDQGASGADLPGGDGLEGQNDVGGRIDGVYPFFRGGAMAAAPPDPDGELVKGRHAAAGGGNHGAAGDVGPQQGADMEAEDGVHSIQRSLLQHDFGSLTLLLGRLEEEADGAPELLPVFLQDLGGPHEHGGVGIMPAGVHYMRDL